MQEDQTEIEQVQNASQTSEAEFCQVLQKHRARLKRLVELRLDNRIRGRVDVSDIVQETSLEAFNRVEEYLADPAVPLFVWLRFLTIQKVAQFHRTHLGTQARNAAREISIHREAPAATSAVLAAQLVGQLTTASQAAVRAEMKQRLEMALNQMNEKDREVLSLRHFEQLSQKETAAVMGLSEDATGSRHVRALAKLKRAMTKYETEP